jgi:hypothetical protein
MASKKGSSSNKAGSSKKSKPIIKPGEKVPDSGIYQSSKSGTRSTIVKGEHAPPTPKKGEKWQQVIDTNPDD